MLGLGTAGLASAAYQGHGMALDRRRYPPPGDLVEADGRKLHLLSTPGAGPPLVIGAALSIPAIDGLSVQRALAPGTSIVLYDRGGLGWSDPGRRPRTVAQMAEELRAFDVAVLSPTNAAATLFSVAAKLLLVVGGTKGSYVGRCHFALQQLATLGLPGGLDLFQLGERERFDGRGQEDLPIYQEVVPPVVGDAVSALLHAQAILHRRTHVRHRDILPPWLEWEPT